MAILLSEKNNCKLSIEILSVNNDLFFCQVLIENNVFSLDFKHNKKTRISRNNIKYIEDNLYLLDNPNGNFIEDDEVLCFYPLDMFLNIDVLYSNSEFLRVLIKIPMGEYSNCNINDFDIILEMSISVSSVKDFFENIILESYNVYKNNFY